METSRLKSLLESLIFVAETPLKPSEMLKAIHAWERAQAKLVDEAEPDLETQAGSDDEVEPGEPEAPTSDEDQVDPSEQLQAFAEEEKNRVSKLDIQEALNQLQNDYQDDPDRGIVLAEVAGGWQFRTRPENASVIRHFFQPKPTRLSKPGLETLSIVAYRQPITRVEIDEIRGVDSGGVLKTLCEKNLVRIVGKKDEPGKPMLYGTTHEFLELFQLKSLKELPGLRDYRDLEQEFRRRSEEEGVVLENEAEEPEEEISIMELSVENELEPLNDEEEEILGGLEESIKGVRKLERDIFPGEKNEEKTEVAPAGPELEKATPNS